MIERKFEAAEGAEAVEFSHGDFGFIVQTLDNSAVEQLLTTEIVEDQFAVLAQRAGIFCVGSMRERITRRHHSSRNLPAHVWEL